VSTEEDFWIMRLWREPRAVGPWFVRPMINLEIKADVKYGPFETREEASAHAQKLRRVKNK